nr:ribosomal protein L14, bacterial-type [Tanacetum cinerariifolium]
MLREIVSLQVLSKYEHWLRILPIKKLYDGMVGELKKDLIGQSKDTLVTIVCSRHSLRPSSPQNKVDSSDHVDQVLKESFEKYTSKAIQTYRRELISYMDALKMLIWKRALHENKWQMKKQEVRAIKEIEKRLNESKMQTQERMVNEGIALDAGLDSEASTYDNTSTEQHDGSSSSRHVADAERTQVNKVVSDKENVAIGPSYDNNTLTENHQSWGNLLYNHSKINQLYGNSMDTKFAEPSILGKPPLQPLRNQSILRQPNAFKSERPKFSKPQFASQVDVKNDLSKLVTLNYWPNVRQRTFAKPYHVIASRESRNSSKNRPRFSSNDMVHNHYLEEAKKKTHERDRNSKTNVMPSARLQKTTNGRKPKSRSRNQMTRNWPTHKRSYKCVFNANHNACITNLLKVVNSGTKVKSHKTTKRYIPVEQKSNTKKPERRISTGHKFSLIKSFALYVKSTPPRSGLTWKPMGRIFTYVGLRYEKERVSSSRWQPILLLIAFVVVYGVVVRAAMQKGRCDVSEVKFDDNAVVLVNKQGEPIGTRVFGLVPHELRKKKHVKILSLAQLIA